MADVLDGKCDMVEDGLASKELDELRLRFRDDKFNHRKLGRERTKTLKRRHRPPDQRGIVFETLLAKLIGNADRPNHHPDMVKPHDGPLDSAIVTSAITPLEGLAGRLGSVADSRLPPSACQGGA